MPYTNSQWKILNYFVSAGTECRYYGFKNLPERRTFPDDEFLKCPQYLVYINKSPNSWEYTGYIIHGNTGKILFQINRFINDKRGSLIDNYMETKRK